MGVIGCEGGGGSASSLFSSKGSSFSRFLSPALRNLERTSFEQASSTGCRGKLEAREPLCRPRKRANVRSRSMKGEEKLPRSGKGDQQSESGSSKSPT